jgi:hypothetical protein
MWKILTARKEQELYFHKGAVQRMTTMTRDHAGCPIESRTYWLNEEMAEFSLLLPARQAAQMERLAHSRNLTLGQLIRLLIRDYLTDGASTAQSNRQPVGKPCDTSACRSDAQNASP